MTTNMQHVSSNNKSLLLNGMRYKPELDLFHFRFSCAELLFLLSHTHSSSIISAFTHEIFYKLLFSVHPKPTERLRIVIYHKNIAPTLS